MRVVIAPDSFGGTLSSVAAAEAIAHGWRRTRPGDDLRVVPMGDGGEGTLQAVAVAQPGARVRQQEVADARGIATTASWLALPDGRALVEAAAACGLAGLDPDARDPLRTTTYGVGQLLAAALMSGPSAVLVGLGGTATVDGGAGMAVALGHRLLRADGNGIKIGGRWVADTTRIQVGSRPAVPVIGAADVDNPLLGPRGAATVYGPQKGANRQAVAELEAALTVWADVVERDLPGGPWRDVPGAGAAGGLGFGLLAFCGAQLRFGAALVGELVGLETALRHADVVVTGEGALDAQTEAGKVPAHVLERGRAAGAKVLALAGRVAPAAAEQFDMALELGPEGLERPAALLAERAAELARTC